MEKNRIVLFNRYYVVDGLTNRTREANSDANECETAIRCERQSARDCPANDDASSSTWMDKMDRWNDDVAALRQITM